MEFLRGPTLPVPFNIIPTPAFLVRTYKKISKLVKKGEDDEDEEDAGMNGIEMPTMNGGANQAKAPGKGGEEKLNHRVF